MFSCLISVAALLSVTGSVLATSSPSYDYIVIGGGTSGLAVANRLSENPKVKVLVVEAGDSVYNNPNVTAANGYGLALGTDIDWQYESTNQTYGGGQKQVLRAGKALSGTSAINGMAYARAEDVQVDAWETIGNEGWTWSSLLPYYLKSENLTNPSTAQLAAGARPNPKFNGNEGPLKVAYSVTSPAQLTSVLNKTHANLGIPWSDDVNGGKMRGLSIFPSTLDADLQIREDAARAYYFPFQNRKNLHVLLNTFANRLVWSGSNNGSNTDNKATARGVEISSLNGTVSIISASQEVIVSAGSLKTPSILELSGIGNPAILSQFHIPVKVNLPTVGENLQDQVNAHFEASTHSKNITGSSTVTYPNVYDVFGNETSSIAASLRSNLQKYARQTASANGNIMKAEDLLPLFELQYDLIFNKKTPIAEILFRPGETGASISSEFWSLLPFARGNVHINSRNPRAKPMINPNYFMLDWDLQAHVGVVKFIRKAMQTAPLRSLVEKESTPGFERVSKDADMEEWKEWVFDGNYRSNFHPVGTAAMMPRSMGGVVDETLTVYGTSNVRVVDASVLPFQVCGHLVSTLYAVAERAADLIKEESDLF